MKTQFMGLCSRVGCMYFTFTLLHYSVTLIILALSIWNRHTEHNPQLKQLATFSISIFAESYLVLIILILITLWSTRYFSFPIIFPHYAQLLFYKSSPHIPISYIQNCSSFWYVLSSISKSNLQNMDIFFYLKRIIYLQSCLRGIAKQPPLKYSDTQYKIKSSCQGLTVDSS